MDASLAARGLVVSYQPDKGRCLVANRAFAPGQIVLEQEPYVCALDDTVRDQRCDTCFKLSSCLKRCSACKHVRYCSEKCQRSAWSIHKQECSIFSRLKSQNAQRPTPSLQMMLRLIFKRSLQSDGAMSTTPLDNYDLVQALPTHMSATDEERLVLYAQMANLIKLILGDEQACIKDITENFCRFACNAHSICDEELRALGNGVYPVVSIINHSCQPNCVLLFEGSRAIVRAVENIRPDTEITISYVEQGESTACRQKTLQEQYFFACHCSRCTDPATRKLDALLDGIRCSKPSCDGVLARSDKDCEQLVCPSCGALREAAQVSKAAELVKEADRLEACGNLSQAKSVLEQAESLQAEVLHPLSVQLMRTRDKLVKLNLSLEEWESALRCCRQTIPTYEIAYPSTHPLLGLQFYTLGKLEWYLGHCLEAVNALKRAAAVLGITHGSRSEFMQELLMLLQDAKEAWRLERLSLTGA